MLRCVHPASRVTLNSTPRSGRTDPWKAGTREAGADLPARQSHPPPSTLFDVMCYSSHLPEHSVTAAQTARVASQRFAQQAKCRSRWYIRALRRFHHRHDFRQLLPDYHHSLSRREHYPEKLKDAPTRTAPSPLQDGGVALVAIKEQRAGDISISTHRMLESVVIEGTSTTAN
ncbi:uncharacterized protein BP01DRAFT_422150 [Aspergillus saccharolyticus JOP 1030-1]|uniref:Uncharacterized protein n=1 Tax=Aspergillus saccharolyticus JOP 1030-1 TaxID=1450539 RepID=A0A318ZGR5_9EURO|nr:hypothetical protein BP01DRAFT_422150 [Aspergillus saccharolyticus JOP 1030-1]PYH46741.1 hypothetical protein BP01DRAFT_422150 [Aspergillus saccharolyticus JOP 1030-1]